MILADTGAVVALIDADDRHHAALVESFESGEEWLLPWVVLPEVDYLVASQLGARAEEAFLADLAAGIFRIAWGDERDLAAAAAISKKHRALRLGLVDGVVLAMAERLRPRAIATLDIRHFGAVRLKAAPLLIPRDLA